MSVCATYGGIGYFHNGIGGIFDGRLRAVLQGDGALPLVYKSFHIVEIISRLMYV